MSAIAAAISAIPTAVDDVVVRACRRAAGLGSPRIDSQIRDVALNYGLMSAYTAFVAVDSSTRTAGSHGTTVAVPVPVPKGVPYDTTVPEDEASAVH